MVKTFACDVRSLVLALQLAYPICQHLCNIVPMCFCCCVKFALQVIYPDPTVFDLYDAAFQRHVALGNTLFAAART
jgi:hypothetical protein